MTPRVKWLRRSTRNVFGPKSIHRTQSIIDLFLARAANASQIGLLLLAVFGYFYTVVPVYQKSLLDEDIAKKTLEFKELQRKNSELAGLNMTAQATARKQYSELRALLVGEFQTLGSRMCRLEDLAEGNFSKCMQDRVLSLHEFSAFSEGDRKLLSELIKKENSVIHAIWREVIKPDEIKKQTAEKRLNEYILKCEELLRTSVDHGIKYADQCKGDSDLTLELNFASSHFQSASENFLFGRLAYIGKAFLGKSPLP